MKRLALLAAILLASAATALAAPATPAAPPCTFDDAAALTGWTVTGDATIDTAKNHGGTGGGALRLGPGSKIVRKFADADGSGTVTMWVYDAMGNPKDTKVRRVGPRWGLLQSDGRVLVMGIIYAPYLSGGDTYVASDSDQKTWFNVQHSRVTRTEGWRKWTFDFDAEKGLTILCDGKRATGFDWNKTSIKGFSGVALFGDNSTESQQTVWVDNLTVQTAGAMKAVPVAPPPPPPVVPDQDPAPEKPVALAPAVAGKHPRLLFTAADVPALKKLAAGEGKVFLDQLNAYLGSSKPPDHTNFLTDATDAQRQGMWRAPTVTLHYVLTGSKGSLANATGFLKKFVETEHWETGEEQDCGMGAANIMVGAALAYDWLYNDLDPALREAARKKLLLQARRMYYGGHLMKLAGIHYWQGDPQNNHRYHRDAGLGLAVLAIAGDGPGDAWILAETAKELAFIHDWLPEDGSCHESPSYMIFGGPYLALAMDASDRCLGTKYLDHPFFKAAPLFRLHTLAPGLKEAFSYGDSGGLGFINNYMFKFAAHSKAKDPQAGLWQFFKDGGPDPFMYGWFSLVWFDPTLTGGSIEKLPTAALWPDLGIATVRDGWTAGHVAALFKCGPYGGRKLNEFRNKDNFRYINVAHDDPDANMFVIHTGGAFLADDDRYAAKKITAAHNTILVNGKGQKGEAQGWTQPLKNVDMAALATVTTWKDTGDAIVAEGEAAGMYPGLERYRRTFIWVRGSYILVLDDIRAAKEADIEWLVQGPDVKAESEKDHRYRLAKDKAACELRLAADREFAATIGDSPAESHGKSLGYKQLRLQAKTARWRVAAAFNAWNLAKLDVQMRDASDAGATVTVTGPNFADTWQVQSPPDGQTPSTLSGRRAGGFRISVGPADKAPLSGGPVTNRN